MNLDGMMAPVDIRKNHVFFFFWFRPEKMTKSKSISKSILYNPYITIGYHSINLYQSISFPISFPMVFCSLPHVGAGFAPRRKVWWTKVSARAFNAARLIRGTCWAVRLDVFRGISLLYLLYSWEYNELVFFDYSCVFGLILGWTVYLFVD